MGTNHENDVVNVLYSYGDMVLPTKTKIYIWKSKGRGIWYQKLKERHKYNTKRSIKGCVKPNV